MTEEMTMEELMEEYESCAEMLKDAQVQVKRLKDEIVKRVLLKGEDVTVGNVTATIRSGYTRKSWDGKALEGYAVANPEILAFRTEKEIKPSVAIKVM